MEEQKQSKLYIQCNLHWKGKMHRVHTDAQFLLEKKIKMLTVVSSDFYFMVTRIFQTFTNMHGLLLISEFSNVTIKQKPSPNDSQVVRTIFLLRVSRAEMRSQAGGPHKGNAEAGILVLSRKLNTNNNNTHFVCIMTRLANYGPKAKSCHSELLAC